MRKCYHIHVDGVGKVHIPGCWPGAIQGEKHCTCYPKKEPTETQKDKKYIRELEKEITRLNRILRKAQISSVSSPTGK